MRTIFVAAICAALTGAAFAQATDEEKAACKADYSRFCSGTIPGGGRVLACLKQHYGSLAPKCRAVVDAHS